VLQVLRRAAGFPRGKPELKVRKKAFGQSTSPMESLGLCGISITRLSWIAENRRNAASAKQSTLQYQRSPTRIPARLCGTLRISIVLRHFRNAHTACMLFQLRFTAD
jgi:hypothetical protein